MDVTSGCEGWLLGLFSVGSLYCLRTSDMLFETLRPQLSGLAGNSGFNNDLAAINFLRETGHSVSFKLERVL
jgi:hypothetical protein